MKTIKKDFMTKQIVRSFVIVIIGVLLSIPNLSLAQLTDVDYNDKVEEKPEIKIDVDDITISSGTKGGRAMWDYVTSFEGSSAGQQAIATDGNYIYTASWQTTPSGGHTFYQYDLQGNFIEGFDISGATGIRDLTTDGDYFYGTSGGSEIFILDFTNRTLVGTINCPGLTSRHIAYDPERDGFWSGNWSTLDLYNRAGAVIQSGPAPVSAYGSAYYKDESNEEHLFLFCQPNSDAKVYDFNINTNTISTTPIFDFSVTPGFNEAIAGGCFIGVYGDKLCWFGNVQQSPNLVGIYEIAASTTPSGYVEDFETGDFSAYAWVNGSTPWTITTNNPYEGTYCMKSGGAGTSNATSAIQVTMETNCDGLMSFYYKISSETNYDKGHFYIDGSELLTVSGTSAWTMKECPVTAGTHTFKWTYTKDSSVNSNDDCFYIDYITFNHNTVTSYSINVSADPVNGGAVQGGGTYPNNSMALLVATANPGYEFENWTKNNVVVSQNASLPIVVTESASYVAHFANASTPSGDVYDFEDGTLQGWTTIDADGDGSVWMLASAAMGTGYGHNGSSDMVLSKSYDNNIGVLYPDNYLVSPAITLGGSITFWACAQDASYAAEHFGVAVSTTTNNSASAFTTIQEWTMTAKGVGAPTNVTRSGNRTQGNWYQYEVDLGAYSGTGYVAIRHFNCSDMFYLDVDDITIANGVGPTYTYNVTLHPNGGTINSGNVTSYTYGVGATLPTDVTRTGYTFGGWYNNSNLTGSAVTSISTTATGDKEFWAKWTVNNYTVTLNTNYGTINSGNVTSYTYGVGATLPTDVTRTGYTFGGWYNNSNLTGSAVTSISTTATGDKEFWAKWTANIYTVTLHPNGGTINSGNVTSYTYGVGATLPTNVTRTGYTFGGWYNNSNLTGSAVTSISTTATGDKKFWAKWTANTYTVTLHKNDGTINNGNVTSYTYGVGATLPTDVTRTGYTFGGWYNNSNLTGSAVTSISTTATGDKEFWAKWTANTNLISANAGANGSIFPQGDIEVLSGEEKAFTITPNFGCRISKVIVDGVDLGPLETYTFSNVHADHTILALFSGWGVEESQDAGVRVFPNPTKGIITVEGQDIADIQVYNLLGEKMLDVEGDDEAVNVNLEHLPSGAYVVLITMQNGKQCYRKVVLND